MLLLRGSPRDRSHPCFPARRGRGSAFPLRAAQGAVRTDLLGVQTPRWRFWGALSCGLRTTAEPLDLPCGLPSLAPQSAGFCPSVASAGRIQVCPRWWGQPALIPPSSAWRPRPGSGKPSWSAPRPCPVLCVDVPLPRSYGDGHTRSGPP